MVHEDGTCKAEVMSTVTLSSSRAVPVPLEEAFDRVLPLPLPDLFRRRFLAIPAIRGTSPSGVWDSPGQTRTIELADGGSMLETLTLVDRPRAFGYTLAGFRGPMKALIASAQGEWGFEPAGTGTRITWSWDVAPTTAGRLVMPAFGAMWQGYARQALEELERLLVD